MKHNLNQNRQWSSADVDERTSDGRHQQSGVKPEWIRLPKSGTLCTHSGLSRSKMNEYVLPSLLNDFKPPVKSISLRSRGQVKAVRLVSYDSLMTHLRSFLQDEWTAEPLHHHGITKSNT